MRCLLYARAVADNRDARLLSVTRQIDTLRQYAQDRDWTVLEQFTDELPVRAAARPALRRLVEVLRTHQVDVVVISLRDGEPDLSDYVPFDEVARALGVCFTERQGNILCMSIWRPSTQEMCPLETWFNLSTRLTSRG